jgi:putative colanic acid biosynthesis UDP-glucose lipid carrier transferase
LIELTREVCDADGDLDLSEDRFMLALALALSLDTKEIDHVVYDSPFRGVKRWLKRLEDLVLGTLFLAICALPMLFIALAIKLTSKGPVLFHQLRHGEDGAEFHVLKFRSMKVMENGPHVAQAQRRDPRITPVGGFLRRTSLDELPQFINVVRGDMSVVGPRPHAVAHNELYRRKVKEYMRRHKVKPGITGWAQVNGLRGETDTLDKMVARVEHDLFYIRNWSLWLDIKVVFLTVFGRKVRQNAY